MRPSSPRLGPRPREVLTEIGRLVWDFYPDAVRAVILGGAPDGQMICLPIRRPD